MKRESILLLNIVIALVLIGIFMVYSASAVDPHANERLVRQIVYVCIGLCAMFVLAHFDYHQWGNPFFFRVIVLFTCALLVLVLVPTIGVIRGGAQRWIEIFGFTFQPSEFGKFALIILLAVKLSANQEEIKSFSKGFLPPILITSIFCGLILLEKDLGGPVVLSVVAFIMMFVAGARWRYLLPSILPVLLGIFVLSITSPHRMKRLLAFLDPWAYSSNEGYQLIQSMTAFVRGSMWGQGAGAGEQKLYYLPEAYTDFIFAVWAEEMGLVGSLILLGLFLSVLVIGMRIAMCAKDVFGTLLATGAVALVGTQAAVNMAVTTGLVPTKGLPLPFISWGGSSLIMFMMLMGVLINVGLQAREPERRGARVPVY